MRFEGQQAGRPWATSFVAQYPSICAGTASWLRSQIDVYAASDKLIEFANTLTVAHER
jgi:hypothetical protein